MIQIKNDQIEIQEQNNQQRHIISKYFRQNDKFGLVIEIPNQESFYFRLNKDNIYYTNDKSDLLVLGAIAINNIQELKNDQEQQNFCLKIQDSEFDEWDICGESQEEIKEWRCEIMKLQGKKCELKQEAQQQLQKIILTQPIIINYVAAPYCNENWNYNNHGNDWQCICSEGKEQSPINIETTCISNPKHNLNQSAQFDWHNIESKFWELKYEDSMIKLKCKSKEFPQECSSYYLGTIIDLDDTIYQGKEVYFHSPAEHTLNGKEFPMEIQVLFQSKQQDNLILSWLIENEPGAHNAFLDSFDLPHLPNQQDPQKDLKDITNGDLLNLKHMFESNYIKEFNGYFDYFYYNGSLTFPGDSNPDCDERVKWVVVTEPVKQGKTVIEMFKSAINMGQREELRNNRRVQRIYDRQIMFFRIDQASCAYKPNIKQDPYQDTYEKLQTKQIEYYLIDGLTVSGLKDSKLVDESEQALLKPFYEKLKRKGYINRR